MRDHGETVHHKSRAARPPAVSATSFSPWQQQRGSDRENERGRHHHDADFQERAEADRMAFTAQHREPQNCGQRTADREIWPKIYADEHGARELIGYGRGLYGAA